MRKVAGIFCLMLMSFAVLAQEDASSKMINVDFTNKLAQGEEPVVFKVTLPMTLIESVRPQIEEAINEINLDEQGIDLPGIWQSIKDAGPNEFVTIKNEEADVKVSTNETHFLVRVNDKQKGEDIDISLPLALGDALFGNGIELDYDSIIDALLSLGDQDLIKVTSPSINGRVWID